MTSLFVLFGIIAGLMLIVPITIFASKIQCQPYNCNPVPCDAAPSIMCYIVFNVNLNKTVQLANPISYPNTTIDPNGCHLDIVTHTQDILKEKQQAPAMYASDAKDASKSSLDAALLWCGIEK